MKFQANAFILISKRTAILKNHFSPFCLGPRCAKLKIMHVTSPLGAKANSFKKNQSLRPKNFQFAGRQTCYFHPLLTGEYSLLRTNHCLFSIIRYSCYYNNFIVHLHLTSLRFLFRNYCSRQDSRIKNS